MFVPEEAKLSLVPVASLAPSPWNPRTVSDARFQNLCSSLEEDPAFLQLRPILATADGTVFAGNMRLRAALHLGWIEVPAILVDIPAQLAKERALRDNGSWGEWDEDELARLLQELQSQGSDLELLGFDERDLRNLLDRIGSSSGLADPDDAPPLPETPMTRPGDLYLLGHHRLLCGDSTDPNNVGFLFSTGEKAKLVATDPPYLVGYDGANRPPSKKGPLEPKENLWDEFEGPEAAVAFYMAYLEAVFPYLHERAPIYQWHANLRQAHVTAAWERLGILVHQVIIWAKPRGVLGRAHFMWSHEPCLYGWRQGKMPNLKPPASETTVWHVDQKGEQDGSHPTQKPVELFKRPILWHTKQGDTVYEPFLGSGTCLIAAEMTGRRCYAMEQDPGYCDVAVARWEVFTGQKAERVEGALHRRETAPDVSERLSRMGMGKVVV